MEDATGGYDHISFSWFIKSEETKQKKGKKEIEISKIGLSSLTPGVLNYLNEHFQDAVLFLHQNCPTSQAKSKSRAFIYFDSIMRLISICTKSLREIDGHHP